MDNFSTESQINMFKNDLNLLKKSKNIRYFCRQFFVRMRDTSIGYDVKYNAILLAIENKQTFSKNINRGECIYFIAWNKYS